MTVSLAQSALADYKAWAAEDKKIFDRINALIQDIACSPFSGLGKPEGPQALCLREAVLRELADQDY
jgi:Txe/YoeB family toxin of Txe-Axe toxin-antitoxin module